MAVVDYFLKIDGIDGESTDAKHKDEIELLSFSWGVSQTTVQSPTGGSTGKVSFQDIHFTTQTSKASPKLMLACATGSHIKTASLVLRKAGEKPLEYLKISLTDILVSSYAPCGNSGENPVEEFSFNFAKIEFDYTPQNADGSAGEVVTTGYDLKAQKSALDTPRFPSR